MKKVKLLSIICIYLCLLMSGCRGLPTFGRHPTDQPSTTWRSEDGSVEFYVPEDTHEDVLGIIETEGQKLDIALNFAIPEATVDVYPLSVWNQWYADGTGLLTREEALQRYEEFLQARYDGTSPETIEEWRTTIISKDTFRIEVVKSTYFREGDTIVFHKVD